MTEISFEDRVKGLRGWPRYDGPHDRAAVELLIWKESWLRRADFVEACVVQLSAGLVARIDWFKAEQFAATVRIASSSERAILELAVTLADRDAHWLKFRGDAHARAVVTAIAAAMEVDIVKPAGPRLAEPERWLVDDARAVLASFSTLATMPHTGFERTLADKLRDVLAILDRVVPQGGDGGE